ncbi:MAG TPA: acyl-CoA dehydrogenase family protein, partial [Steroidobacteraceae bacterium]
MPLTSPSAEFQQQLARLEGIAREVAACNAADVDARSRFPEESLAALKQARLLAAPVPKDMGGAGCGVLELAELCSTLAKACGSSAMVLAMHFVQVACLARHAARTEFFHNYLRQLAERQYLLASMTSENGTFGEMRTSICAVRRD